MPSSECLSIAEAEANAKAISKVPEMLSIVERLAARRKDVCVHPGSKEDMLIGDAEKLINELNH